VDSFVVEADQDVSRETVHKARGGTRAVLSHDFAAHIGDFLRAGASTHTLRHLNERDANDSANFLER
jgi:hypothetical protein